MIADTVLTWFRFFVHVDLQLEITSRILAAAVVLVKGTGVHLVGPLAVTGGQRIRPVVLETRDGSGQRDIGCAAPPTGQGDGSVRRRFGLVPIGRQGRNGHGSDIATGELEKPLARHERGDSRSPAQETTDRVAMTSNAHIPRLRTGTSTPPFRFQQNTYCSVFKLSNVSDTSHSWDRSPATDVIG